MELGSALALRVAEDGISSRGGASRDDSGKRGLAERLKALEPYLGEIFYRFGVLEEFRDVIQEVANRETHQDCLANLYNQLAELARRKSEDALSQGHLQLAEAYVVESTTWAAAARLADIGQQGIP